jgi:ankyrin repeat protein
MIDVVSCLIQVQRMSENLWDALYFRNPDTINALLDAGADINFKNDCCFDQTPLHIMIERGWFELAALLIQRGADVNVADSNGDTPLYAAIRCRNVELAQKLIDAGAIIDRLQRFSPLHMAVFEDQQIMIDLLLDAGASIDFLQNGETAVEYAASFGNQPLVHHFLRLGAKQSLHVSAAIDDIEVIRQHIISGGEIDERSGEGLTSTLLYISAVNNQLAIAKLLLNAGADPDCWCNCDDVALMSACKKGFSGMVELLIDAGADIDQGDLYGGILTNIAASGCVELARWVICKHKVAIHSDSYYAGHSHTPAMAAATHGHLDMLKFLLEQGSEFPFEAIFDAAIAGHGEMLQFLVQHGADPNLRSFGRETALDRLAGDGDLAKAELLLSVGADVNAGITTGHWTALHHAVLRGNLAMANLLVAAGADVNATDRCGHTPLRNATLWRSDDVIDFLLANGAKR